MEGSVMLTNCRNCCRASALDAPFRKMPHYRDGRQLSVRARLIGCESAFAISSSGLRCRIHQWVSQCRNFLVYSNGHARAYGGRMIRSHRASRGVQCRQALAARTFRGRPFFPQASGTIRYRCLASRFDAILGDRLSVSATR